MAPKEHATHTACQVQDGNLLNALPEQALQTICAKLSIADKTFFAKSSKWCHDLVCEHLKEITWFLSCATPGAAVTLSKAGKRKAGGLTLRMNLEGCSEAMISDALHQCMSQAPYTAVKRLMVRGQGPDSKTLCSGFGSLLGLAFPAVEELDLWNLCIVGTGLFCSLQHCKGLRKLSMLQVVLDATARRASHLIKQWAPGLTSIEADVNVVPVLPLEQYAAQVKELELLSAPNYVNSCTNLTAIILGCCMDRALLQSLCSLPHLQHVSVLHIRGVAAAGGAGGATSLVPPHSWHTLAVKWQVSLQDLPLLPLSGLQLLDLSAAFFTASAEAGPDAVVQVLREAGAALAQPASVKWESVWFKLYATAAREMGEEDAGEPPPSFLAAKTAAMGAISSLLQRPDTPDTLVVRSDGRTTWSTADVRVLGLSLASIDWASRNQALSNLHLEPVRVDGVGFWKALHAALPPSVRHLDLALCRGAHNIAPVQLGIWCATAPAPLQAELFISRDQDNGWDAGVRQALQEVQQTLREADGAPVSLKVHWDRGADAAGSASGSESGSEDGDEDDGSSDGLEGEEWFVDEVEEGELDRRLMINWDEEAAGNQSEW